MIKASDLCTYARNAVNGGYCYGSSGETCTLARRKQWAEWNPSQKANLLGICAKWDGKTVWDCSGLFRGAWRALASYKSGGATTIYKTWCIKTGKIGTMPNEPGIAVFKGNDTAKDHIGLFVGKGMVVDARSASKGVLCGKLESYPWTHWGRLAEVLYSDIDAEGYAGNEGTELPALYRAKVTNVKIGLNLRSTPANEDNTILLLPPGAVVDLLRENCGNGFAYVRHGQICGYSTQSLLTQVD